MARTWNPRTWVTGDALNATNLNTVRDSLKAVGDPWDGYTPVWTATGTAPSIGNGTVAGAWAQMGKLIHFRVILTAGSTTTFGTGTWLFTLPISPNLVGNIAIGGGAISFDSSAVVRYPGLIVTGSTTGQCYVIDSGSHTNNFATVPFTWASGDVLSFAGTYESV